MTPREISADEVRLGDRIRWVYNGMDLTANVADIDFSSPGLRVCVGDNTIRASFWLDSDGMFTLLDRPLPPIPTDEGTVIKRRAGGFWALAVRINGQWRDATDHRLSDEYVTRDEFDVLVPERVDQ